MRYVRKVEGTEELIHEFDPLGKKLVDTDWIEWLKKTSIFRRYIFVAKDLRPV